MSTLKLVVEKLEKNNQILEENNKSLDNMGKNISKVEAGILGLFALQKSSRLDDLEESREPKKAATLKDSSSKGVGSTKSGTPLFAGLLDSVSGLFSMAGLTKFLIGGLKKLPFLLMTVLGDELSEFLQSSGFKKDLADDIGRSVSFAGLAGIISKRLVPLGALIGLVIDEDTGNKIGKIIEDFKKDWADSGMSQKIAGFFNAIIAPINELFKSLGIDFKIDKIDKVSWTAIVTWLRTNLIEGVQGIADILNPKEKIEWGDITSAVGLLGTIAFAFAPFKTIGLLYAAVKGTALGGLKLLFGGKLLSAVKTLGLLAFGLGSAADAIPADAVMSKSGNLMKKGVDGKATTVPYDKVTKGGSRLTRALTGMMGFATGPVGLAILGLGSVAALGYFVTEATKDAPIIKELRKKSDDMIKAIGGENATASDLMDESMGMSFGSDKPATQSARKPGTPEYEAEIKRLEALAASGNTRADGMLALYKASHLEKIESDRRLTEAILNDQKRRQQNQISPIINAPTTNTSIGQSSTAFVGSGTNSFDMNNPNAMRAMERRLAN